MTRRDTNFYTVNAKCTAVFARLFFEISPLPLYTIDRVCACVCACVRACVEDYFDCAFVIVQELCESRGGRPGLSVLTSLLVSVDVKLY